MDKMAYSERINLLLGGEKELFCYRIYIQARLWGGLWISLEKTINVTFYLIRGERDHVRMNYIWQKREHGKNRPKGDM